MSIVGAAAAFLALLVAIPSIVAFTSIDRGLQLAVWFYPYKQTHTAFRQHPAWIQSHVLFSGVALTLAVLLHPVTPWSPEGGCYLAFLLLGSVCAVRFSALNAAHSTVVTASFSVLAASSCLPALLALNAAYPERWLMRSYAALFGAGVVFRAMAPHCAERSGNLRHMGLVGAASRALRNTNRTRYEVVLVVATSR